MTPSPALLERFLVYLCDEVGVTPDTANQYLSHVTRSAVHWGLVDTSAELRSEGVRLVLAGLRQEQALVAQPRRDSSRIPFTWDMFLLLDGGVLSRLPLIRRVALRAAFAVGFGASLRPGEYLPQLDQQFDPRKHVCVENIAVWYGEVAYPLCSNEVLLGSERATSLHIHLSYRKKRRCRLLRCVRDPSEPVGVRSLFGRDGGGVRPCIASAGGQAPLSSTAVSDHQAGHQGHAARIS